VYNLDRRNPHAPEAQHDDPDELLALFHQAQAEATDLREQLRRALADALEGRA
jgi:type I restriction enzyme M protein